MNLMPRMTISNLAGTTDKLWKGNYFKIHFSGHGFKWHEDTVFNQFEVK